jgi:prepilin-type N-terminal cleavage/methylation domain-containing protein
MATIVNSTNCYFIPRTHNVVYARWCVLASIMLKDGIDMRPASTTKGFTLLEIMIVVAIIGLLVAIGIPSMMNADRNTRTNRFARDIKTAGHAFVQYAFDQGHYPADTFPGQMPDGMSAYLSNFPWSEETVVGGRWDWDFGVFGITAGVSVQSPGWNATLMQAVDIKIDDGNLGTGHFRQRPGGFIYILEE